MISDFLGMSANSQSKCYVEQTTISNHCFVCGGLLPDPNDRYPFQKQQKLLFGEVTLLELLSAVLEEQVTTGNDLLELCSSCSELIAETDTALMHFVKLKGRVCELFNCNKQPKLTYQLLPQNTSVNGISLKNKLVSDKNDSIVSFEDLAKTRPRRRKTSKTAKVQDKDLITLKKESNELSNAKSNASEPSQNTISCERSNQKAAENDYDKTKGDMTNSGKKRGRPRKPFSCEHCKLKFLNEESVKSHTAKHHSNQLAPVSQDETNNGTKMYIPIYTSVGTLFSTYHSRYHKQGIPSLDSNISADCVGNISQLMIGNTSPNQLTITPNKSDSKTSLCSHMDDSDILARIKFEVNTNYRTCNNSNINSNDHCVSKSINDKEFFHFDDSIISSDVSAVIENLDQKPLFCPDSSSNSILLQTDKPTTPVKLSSSAHFLCSTASEAGVTSVELPNTIVTSFCTTVSPLCSPSSSLKDFSSPTPCHSILLSNSYKSQPTSEDPEPVCEASTSIGSSCYGLSTSLMQPSIVLESETTPITSEPSLYQCTISPASNKGLETITIPLLDTSVNTYTSDLTNKSIEGNITDFIATSVPVASAVTTNTVSSVTNITNTNDIKLSTINTMRKIQPRPQVIKQLQEDGSLLFIMGSTTGASIVPSLLKISPEYLNTDQNDSTVCDICSRSFKNSRSMTMHRNSVHGNKKNQRHKLSVSCTKNQGDTVWDCQYCETTYADKNTLTQHLKAAHNSGIDQESSHGYTCSVCSQSFRFKYQYQKHQDLHIPCFLASLNEYKCGICRLKLGSKKSLKVHLSRLHGNRASADNFLCSKCGFMTCFKRRFTEHMNQHSDETCATQPAVLVRCNLCHKQLRSVSLRMHKLRQHGIARHTCEYCPKKFRMVSDRVKHENIIHTKEKPYQCDACRDAFASADLLRYHRMSVHKICIGVKKRHRSTGIGKLNPVTGDMAAVGSDCSGDQKETASQQVKLHFQDYESCIVSKPLFRLMSGSSSPLEWSGGGSNSPADISTALDMTNSHLSVSVSDPSNRLLFQLSPGPASAADAFFCTGDPFTLPDAATSAAGDKATTASEFFENISKESCLSDQLITDETLKMADVNSVVHSEHLLSLSGSNNDSTCNSNAMSSMGSHVLSGCFSNSLSCRVSAELPSLGHTDSDCQHSHLLPFRLPPELEDNTNEDEQGVSTEIDDPSYHGHL